MIKKVSNQAVVDISQVFVTIVSVVALCVCIYIASTVVSQNAVGNEIREQLTPVEPYDIIKGINVFDKGYGWWFCSVCAMDTDTGVTTYDSFRYNTNTKEFSGNMSIVEIINE